MTVMVMMTRRTMVAVIRMMMDDDDYDDYDTIVVLALSYLSHDWRARLRLSNTKPRRRSNHPSERQEALEMYKVPSGMRCHGMVN